LLSLVVPVKNEVNYIDDLVSSFLEVDDKRVELVISDNISDDGTFEKISSITCDDIRVFRPKESLSPFDNHKFALSQAQGQFVFPLGGDDYISPDCLKYILDILKPGRIVVPVTRCFKDKTNETIQLTNTKQQIELLFNKSGVFDIGYYLKRINYDELIFNICEKKLLNDLFLIKPNTVETFATWSNIFLFFGFSIDNIDFVDSELLSKRYCKTYSNSTFSIDQGYSTSTIYEKSLSAIYNAFVFFSVNKAAKESLLLLFSNRYAVGYYKKDNPNIKVRKLLAFSPLFMIIIYPLIVLRNLSRKLVS